MFESIEIYVKRPKNKIPKNKVKVYLFLKVLLFAMETSSNVIESVISSIGSTTFSANG